MIKLNESLVMNAKSAKTTADDSCMELEAIKIDRVEQWLHRINNKIKEVSTKGYTATMVQALSFEDERALAEQYLIEKGYTITHERLTTWHVITIKW